MIWVGCPHCNYFVRMSERTYGWICRGCGKYVRANDCLKEKDMDSDSKVEKAMPHIASSEAKNLYRNMEKKTEKWVKDVKDGKHPYTDINGKKVQ